MPKFHFQLRTEATIRHSEAVELAIYDDARIEAARQAGEILKEHAGQLWVDEDWQMDVTDEADLILFVIYISAVRSAAVR